MLLLFFLFHFPQHPAAATLLILQAFYYLHRPQQLGLDGRSWWGRVCPRSPGVELLKGCSRSRLSYTRRIRPGGNRCGTRPARQDIVYTYARSASIIYSVHVPLLAWVARHKTSKAVFTVVTIYSTIYTIIRKQCRVLQLLP